MKLKYNGREVEVDVEGFGDHGDEMFVSGGFYYDTKQDLTDEECDDILQENFDALYERQYEFYASEAYDRAKDAWKYGD